MFNFLSLPFFYQNTQWGKSKYFFVAFASRSPKSMLQKIKNLPIFVKMSEATDHILCKVLVNILLNIYEGLCRIIKAQ